MNSILRATPDLASSLTQITFASKRYWGYPELWIEIWAPLLTITKEFIRENETYKAYVNVKPVGFYAISKDRDRASLEHLWVLPKFMGQGIGKALFQHAIERCKKLGVDILEIESDPNAQGFYERIGACKVGETFGEVDGQRRVLPVLEFTIST